MRLILTGLAAALTLALIAALVGPGFVDWTAMRPQIEARLSQALGARVTLGGPLALELLPSPRLSVGRASLGSGEGGAPRLDTGAARFELSAPALLRGEWRFVEARLDKPTLSLSLDAQGRLVGAPEGEDWAASFETLRVIDGAIVARDAKGERLRLDHLDFTGSADGLKGPFKGQGSAGGARRGFRFATGAVKAGAMRLKLVLDAAKDSPKIEVEGSARLAGAVGFEGQASAQGALQGGTIWKAGGALSADASGARLDPLEIKIGGDERPTALTGVAAFDAGAGQAALTLAARQIDLDRLLGRDGQPTTPRAALAAAATFFAGLLDEAPGLSRTPLTLDLSPGVVTLGGEASPDARLTARLAPGAPAQITLEASLPARSRIVAEGRLEGGAAARFRGKIEASTLDARRLARWLGDLAPAGVTPPFAEISLSGEADISQVSLSLRGAKLKLDRTPLEGDVTYVAPMPGEHGRLFADLTSEALDLDGAPDLTALIGAAPDYDFSVSLAARAVRLARFGEGQIEAGRIRLAVRREGGRLDLEKLSIQGLGGADLTAQGAIDAAGGAFTLALDAERLGDLAALLERVAPGRLSAALARRAARLSPARVTLSAQAGPDLALTRADIKGALAGAQIVGSAARAEGALSGRIEAAQGDVVALLRQLGLEARGPARLGPARIAVDFSEGGDGRLALRGEADGPEAKLAFEGAVDPGKLFSGAPQELGTLRVEAQDAAPLLVASGVLAPNGFAHGPAHLATALSVTPEGLAARSIAGEAFGVAVSGDAVLSRGGGRGAISGRLTLDRLSAGGVAALALGVSPPAGGVAGRGGKSLWSERAFAPALAPDAPEARFALEARRCDLGAEAFGIGGAPGPGRAVLTIAPGAVSLDEIDAPFADGRARGALAWRRDGLEASFSGKIAISGARFELAPASGAFSASLDVAGAGRNPAALAASLGGQGQATLSGLTLRQTGGGAIAAAIAGLDAEKFGLDANALERALAARLDAGARVVAGPVAAPITVAGGALRMGPVAAPGADDTLAATLTLDLRRLTYEARESFVAKDAPTRWTGSAPRFEAIWSGGPDAPHKRALDASMLLNGLAARQLALELDRIEAYQADLMERARFAREMKAWRFLDRRDAEIASFKAEQARLVDEARKAEAARLAEEARKAEDVRKAEDARKAEAARKAEVAARQAEAARNAEAARQAKAASDAAGGAPRDIGDLLGRAEPALRGEPAPASQAPLDIRP